MWSYGDALAWLYERQKHGVKLGLANVQALLAAVGNPEAAFQSVHVAGTNGKGSVTHMVAGALQRAGHKTGLYTSPHLVRFGERVRVNGEPIDDASTARLLATLKDAVEGMEAKPTFFEVTTALAFLHFKEQGATWAVLETGMGGRLDATNVVQPALTVITSVDLDHQAYLGPTLADITYEKAGILKQRVPLVTAVAGESLAALKSMSHALEVPMSVVGEDYQILPDINGMRLLGPTGESHYDIAMAGEHQLQNAATAVACCEALRAAGVALPAAAVHASLAETRVPGRMQTVVGDHATFLLDGAHNPAGAHWLRHHLGQLNWAGFTLVCGFMQDKQWQDMLDAWMPLAKQVIAVRVASPRSLDPAEVVQVATRAGWPAEIKPLEQALAEAEGEVLVAGSLWLIGEAIARLHGEAVEEIRGSQ